MPEITINQLNSDSQKVVEYANNSELLETLLTEYDKKLNPKNTRLSIGLRIKLGLKYSFLIVIMF